jgi:hypothetical protein
LRCLVLETFAGTGPTSSNKRIIRFWPDTLIPVSNVRFSGVERTCRLQCEMSAYDPKRTSRRELIGARFDVVIAYFVIMRRADGGASPGAAGAMAIVSQAFQPSGLFCAANSP